MTDGDIRFERKGMLGLVTLTRPKALNALTLGMIRAFDPQLAAWADDPEVAAVIVTGAGGKAFCAGGDVAALYHDRQAEAEGRSDGAARRDFFREEYRLNRRIKRFPKPYVALVDGISMGGGVGISVHGSHRVVTEKTLVAMPETAIGLFPDVGGTFVLPRCPGRTGIFLALTGGRIRAADCLYLGLADHFVPSDSVPALIEALAAEGSGPAGIDGVVERFVAPGGDSAIAAHREAIDRCFASETVEGIIAALEAEGTPWSDEIRGDLSKFSPTSLKVTLEAMRRGASLDFEAAMVMEYRLSQACMAGTDFYEGVRAVLVDKDRNPRWNPSALAAVDEATVERHFAAPSAGDLTFAD